jgi:hypothetical protein
MIVDYLFFDSDRDNGLVEYPAQLFCSRWWLLF